ncbi:stress-related protein-like [Salvia divinorum]|uniref:Stress-related protein-like n=1 Tax=Salvia divinorum TaxID=28513 RepID=A0ABD1H041_SALDI
MAITDCSLQQPKSARGDESRPRLKYLDFVVVATLHVMMLIASIYCFAKERSGRLKPTINVVEHSVRTLFAPLYAKSHHLPIQLLNFADRKVDESVQRVKKCVPSSLRRASFKAFNQARRAPVAARCVMADVQKTGMVETASGLAKSVYAKYEPVAKDLYTKYEPVTEEYALYVWRLLNQYALFQRAALAAGPLAGYCSEMYNQKVEVAAKSGYKVAAHLPVIPVEKIAEALRTENMKPVVIDGGRGEEDTTT